MWSPPLLQKCRKDTAHSYTSSEECDEMLRTNYKFYLAFENSICDEYVTEKFFRALRLLVVPIVLRKKDYEHIAPPNSFIAVDQFNTVEGLASYIKYINSNNSAYASYLEWSRCYRVIDDTLVSMTAAPLCQLCRMLHDNNLPHKTVRNLERWWTAAQCDTHFVNYQMKMKMWNDIMLTEPYISNVGKRQVVRSHVVCRYKLWASNNTYHCGPGGVGTVPKWPRENGRHTSAIVAITPRLFLNS